MFSKAIIGSTFLAAVSAHQNFHQFWVNGETPGYQVGIRMPPSNNPVTDVTSNDIACNVNGSDVPSGVDTVAANEGDTIKVQWDQSSHPGPITHMLFGPVDDASQATGIGSWVKIDELDYVNGTWANEIMGVADMTRTFKLPTGLKSGEYLLRSEMLALHGSQTVGGAQFYIGCAQLKITGTDGSCTPSIELPGAYNAEDSNIYIPNVYSGFDPTNYTAPGGPVAECGGSGAAASTSSSASTTLLSNALASSTAVAAPSGAPIPSSINGTGSVSSYAGVFSSGIARPSTFATVVTSALNSTSAIATPTSTGSIGKVAKKYQQCGGTGWTGSITCEAGLTCTKHSDNAFYSQCL